jgi:hypothetical protein
MNYVEHSLQSELPVASPRDLTNASTEYPVVSIRLKSTRLDAIVILTALSIMGITNNSDYNWKVDCWWHNLSRIMEYHWSFFFC